VSSSCSDGSNPASIGLSGGETVTCTFHDARERGAIEITKTRKHAADGSGNHPHAGVEFTISGGGLTQDVTVTTNAQGVACADGLLLSSFQGVGDYTVTEDVPAGYVSDDAEKTVTVTDEATCGSGTEAGVSFHNTPKTNVTVSVDSQVEGGTASTIDCVDGEGNPAESGSTDPDTGDGSVSNNDLLPTDPDATLVCTITVDP
jgi:hypothetical protein